VPVPPPEGANWPATAALACGILGGALITIPAGLLLAALGFRRARQGSRGRVRGWAAVILSLAWAGAAGYLVPHRGPAHLCPPASGIRSSDAWARAVRALW
jgi:hypothetical protein